MSPLDEISNFINYVKHETDKPFETPKMMAYQRVLKELKPEERKLLLDIIRHPEMVASEAKVRVLASRIKELTAEVQDPNFKSHRKIGAWHSFCRIMKNIFLGRVGSNKLIGSIADSKAHDGRLNNFKAPEAIVFKKGETQAVIPRNKNKPLGKGNVAGPVYEHGTNSKLAVKKVGGADCNEYNLGATLQHPNLARTYQVYTKQYAPDEGGFQKRDKNLIVMDKIEGKNMNYYYRSNEAFSSQKAAKLLTQAKDCCGYLFDQNVAWKDINDGNIFIEKKTGNLKLIDFGFWSEENDPKVKGLNLLFGAMEIAGWIVRNAPQGKKRNPNRIEFLGKVLFPERFFNEKLAYTQIVSFASHFYNDVPWVKELQHKMEAMSDEEIKRFVTSYFDHVIAELNSLR